MLHHTCDEADEADAQFTGFYQAAALAEASMLVERNEPQPGEPQEPNARHNALSALAEGLASFVAGYER